MHVYTCKSEISKVNFLLFIFSFIFEPKFVTVTSKRKIQILLIKSSLVYLDWSFFFFHCPDLTHSHYCNFTLLPDHPASKKQSYCISCQVPSNSARTRNVTRGDTDPAIYWQYTAGADLSNFTFT